MALTAGSTPQFAYHDSTNDYVKYAYYYGLGSDGSSVADNGWNCRVVSYSGGHALALAIQQEGPERTHLAYYDQNDGKLHYAYTEPGGLTDGNCAPEGMIFTWQCDEIADMGVGQDQIGLAMTLDEHGYPLIAYQDITSDYGPTKLRFASPAVAFGWYEGNCGRLYSGDDALSWWCRMIERGSQYTSEGRYIGIAMDPDGLGTIVYHEDDEYNLDANLKIAQQQYASYVPWIQK